jgi:hypothetical protein
VVVAAPLVRVPDLAEELLGENSDRNRKLVRRLVARGVLATVENEGGDPLILRASVDAWLVHGMERFIAELEGMEAAVDARRERAERRAVAR